MIAWIMPGFFLPLILVHDTLFALAELPSFLSSITFLATKLSSSARPHLGRRTGGKALDALAWQAGG
jgi:hypothetical protein